MKMQQLHEDTFHNIPWNNESRVIGLDWKEGTSSMTGEDFKKELTLFADHTAAATQREWIESSLFDELCQVVQVKRIALATSAAEAVGSLYL